MKARRFVVPLALTVSVVAGAMAIGASTAGCDDSSNVDAGVDTTPDTPII